MPAKRDPEARFWEKVDKSAECWLWTGAVFRTGYGAFSKDLRPTYAHRVAWEWANGPIPSGVYVCHTCDTRRCVRPDHLFLGTQLTNMQDAVQKGRFPTGANHWTWRSPTIRKITLAKPQPNSGSQNGNARLSEDDVRIILAALRGGVHPATIAPRFGVSVVNIREIAAGKRWRHVPR